MDNLKTNDQNIYLTLAPTLPTMQVSHWVTSLEAIYQITWNFLWNQKKALHYFFTYAVVLHKTCKHTLMCKIGGVTL